MFMNAGARGYYRTAYTPDMLRALVPMIETHLSAPERLSLAGDEWALVRARRHTAADYLTLASGFVGEQTSGVLEQIRTGLRFIHDYLTAGSTRSSFQNFVRSLLARQKEDLANASAAAAADAQRELAAVVVETLGTIGEDPDIVSGVRQAVDAALAGRRPLDPIAADAFVRVAAKHGDARLWDAFAAAAERAQSPEEQYRYLYALGDFEDPALADRGLAHALTPAVRAQNAGRYLARFLGNPAINARSWNFVKQHWVELQPKISVAFADVRIVQALASFCDARSRDDIRGFFSSHRLGNADRTVDQTIERIDNCIALRESQSAAVAGWLRNR
jgi:aminopeptidase N/puromycin-sensitive aminopeptidase